MSRVKPLSPAGEKPVGSSGNSASMPPIATVATPSVFQRFARHQRTRPRYHVMIHGVVTTSSCGLRKNAAIIGVSVRATSSENSTAIVTVKPNGRKNSPGDAAHERHRDEHGADRQRRCDHREADLDGGVHRGLARLLAHAQVPHDVLHLDDRVVDEHADDERQRQQRQRVQREAEHRR